MLTLDFGPFSAPRNLLARVISREEILERAQALLRCARTPSQLELAASAHGARDHVFERSPALNSNILETRENVGIQSEHRDSRVFTAILARQTLARDHPLGYGERSARRSPRAMLRSTPLSSSRAQVTGRSLSRPWSASSTTVRAARAARAQPRALDHARS